MQPIDFDASCDQMFGGALMLHQPKRGHRAGTDAVLLAAATPPDALLIADLGAASGVVGLRAAQMNALAEVSLIERDEALVALAQRNIAQNGLEARAFAHAADVFALGKHLQWRETFDCVLTNPPFYCAEKARRSPDTGKADAHVMPLDALDDWLRNASTILKPKGTFVMIHAAESVQAVLNSAQARFGDLRLRFIHPSAEKPAIRLLIKGVKGSRAPLQVLPPLILNEPDGAFTPHAAALHEGRERLLWT